MSASMNFYDSINADRENFCLNYTIRTLLLNAIYVEGYSLPDALIDKIKLTKEGSEFLGDHPEILRGRSELAVMAGMLLAIGHDNYWIASNNDDLLGILNILSVDVSSKRITFPWIFGRDLHGLYDQQDFKGKEELNWEETAALMANMPQGVFQVGYAICGPFGILLSEESRSRGLIPSLDAPIRICPDPTCRATHTVDFTGPMPDFIDAFEDVEHLSSSTAIDIPDMMYLFRELSDTEPSYYSTYNTYGFPALLANAFVLDELRAIVGILLSKKGDIRRRFPRDRRLRGDAKEIVNQLNHTELLQIALLASTHSLIDAIEVCISDKSIFIPRGEIRRARFNIGRGGWQNTIAECSPEGVRFVPADTNGQAYLAQTRLRNIFYSIFPDEGSQREQLDYVLRAHDGSSVEEKLHKFINSTSPEQIIRNVFLPVVSRVKEVERELSYGAFISPDGADGDTAWVRKVFWKLGYDVKDVESRVSEFEDHSKNFSDVVRRTRPVNNASREQIRQASASYFVALEGILDLALTYSAWALCSDHYGESEFKFCAPWAKDSVVKVLEDATKVAGSDITFGADGQWTLHPLIEGLRILATYLEVIDAGEKAAYLRPEKDFPGFTENPKAALFPFKHVLMFLDLSPASKNFLLDHFKWVSSKLQSANVPSIRNRLQHNRPVGDFPSQDELESMLELVNTVLKRMEFSGSLPSPMVISRVVRNEYGCEIVSFRDFRGGVLDFLCPHELNATFDFERDVPAVIFRDAVISNTSVPLHFGWIGSSEYVDYWRGYPS